eukprot:jgi/Chlat1/3513/Chrsp23S03794
MVAAAMTAMTAAVAVAPALQSARRAFAGQALPTVLHSQKRLSRRSMSIVAGLAQRLEYIWSDGQEGQPSKGMLFNQMRSKTKVVQKPLSIGNESSFPEWSFDGSSTGQAEGSFSDCILKPVFSCTDPIRGGHDLLVLCEVLTAEGNPHETNSRSKVRDLLKNESVAAEETLFGFEQEYTMLDKRGKVYGWPESGYPAAQGPFYCGVGLESSGLKISGINAEVLPGQWEFQIGPAGPLEVGDHVMIARWLLHRLGEDMGINATFDAKPVPGEWNGTGGHTNYSTKTMRAEGGIAAINAAIEKLSKKHPEHISVYGVGNERRLTGKCETANINTFKSGVADRGASIRIPLPVSLEGKGYLEDRRPAANVDPYVVAGMLIKTTLT